MNLLFRKRRLGGGKYDFCIQRTVKRRNVLIGQPAEFNAVSCISREGVNSSGSSEHVVSTFIAFKRITANSCSA